MSSSSQFRFRLSKNGSGHLFFVSTSVALVALSFVAGINVSDATTRMAMQTAEQTVNRTQKGDRLLMAPASRTHLLKQPHEIRLPALLAVDAKLPEGCDPLISPIADERLANIASRCVS